MDAINPDHYKAKPVETIEKMVRIWGARRVAEYCEINAFKYRERAGLKETSTIEEDIRKALWWEDKMKELMETYDKDYSLKELCNNGKVLKKSAAPQKA